MDIDLDPLEDIFGNEPMQKARTFGKFQPKLKPRLPPRKNAVATSVSSTLAAQNSAENDSSKLVRTAMPSENYDKKSSGSVSPLHQNVYRKDIDNVTPNVSLELEFVSNGKSECSDHMEKSAGENANIYIGLEALGDFSPHATSVIEGTPPSSEEVAFNVLNSENAEGGLAIPAFSVVTSLTHTPNVADVPSCPGPLTDPDPLISGDIINSSCERGVCMDNRGLGVEEIDVMDSVIMSELTTKSVQRTGKFQPKPKVQIQKKIGAVGSESVSDQNGSPPVPSISGCVENFSSLENDDALDLSSIEFTHSMPTEGTSEIPLNEEFMDLMNTAQLGIGIHVEGIPEFPAKLASRRAKTGANKAPVVPDPSLQLQKSSTSFQENETGRSLRPRKSKASLLEQVDEITADSEFSNEIVVLSPTEEDNIDNEQFHMESESKTKKVRGKSKRPHDDTEKPDKNRRKAKEASGQGENAKPKKFSHSTRRRRVDKVLLETPEDEIDFQRVPLRDLIILAEHKEKQMKKEEAAAGKPAAKQSKVNSSAYHDEDETFNSTQDGEYDDREASTMVEESNMYFNYQTYMDKEPRTRWSKQDTELFYEGVRQFGTDLSMIQHLFPGRSRRQVKLKYKKEEKQHPLLLCDALTTRAKDHSHFNMVIERLKQIVAEENQNADKDESVDLTGEEVVEAGSLNADDEEARNELVEDAKKDDAIEAAPSPVKPSYDSEDDDTFDWSQYKSDL